MTVPIKINLNDFLKMITGADKRDNRIPLKFNKGGSTAISESLPEPENKKHWRTPAIIKVEFKPYC